MHPTASADCSATHMPGAPLARVQDSPGSGPLDRLRKRPPGAHNGHAHNGHAHNGQSAVEDLTSPGRRPCTSQTELTRAGDLPPG